MYKIIINLYFRIKFLLLPRKVYESKLTIPFIDQLGSPNKELVESYYGNITDTEAAERFGTTDLEEYSHWAWRSCAIANVAMILRAFKKYDGTVFELVKKVKDAEGYLFEDKYGNKDIGWKHHALIDTFTAYGIKSERFGKVSVYEFLLKISTGYVALASIKSRISSGSHMVVVNGFEKTKNGTIVHYVDPYNLDGRGGKQTKRLSEFKEVFNGKGIYVAI